MGAVFFVNSEHRILNKQTLLDLCIADRKLVAPLLIRRGTMFSNFGDLLLIMDITSEVGTMWTS